MRFGSLLLTFGLLLGALPSATAGEHSTKAPAVPLVACDPYFSIWSPGTTLTGQQTTHWTGRANPLTGIVSIDGKSFRFLGAEPAMVAPLPQTDLQITPTQSIYTFEGQGIRLVVNFTTPAIPYDIDLLSRPITYVTYDCQSTDGQPHAVKLYFAAGGALVVNGEEQQVEGISSKHDGLVDLKLGSVEQNVLGKKGDDLRIDWGYLHLASKADQTAAAGLGNAREMQRQFLTSGTLGQQAGEKLSPRVASRAAVALVFDLGKVAAEPTRRWLVLAYDDIYAIEFMEKPLLAYWKRDGKTAETLLAEAARDHAKLLADCAKFDSELMADLRAAGGEKYAHLCALSYRQCFAAGKFVADSNGQPIQFCKENHSNGCIGTSDVFYPMAPQFLLFGPSLAKSFVVPFMEYAASDRWKFPFAPHDLGTYPKANGQVYGGGERTEENQMPVEESGNMLLLMAAIAKIDGNTSFADRYWDRLTQWADYLKEKGFDPENQLCTDDFAGHLAHNVNLSAKAICGLGAYAQLCEMRGEETRAAEYRKVAEEFAARWVKEAADGDHYRLAFDKPGSWSQKYNLVWDKVLGLKLFPDSVYETELAYYKKMQNKYGLPLDNRREYTKLDWILWTASITQKREDFEALVAPVYEFLSDTPQKAPLTDWYETKDGRKVGFTARPVIGGVFMQTLHNADLWKKWAGRDTTQAKDYAPMPKPPRVDVVVPTAETSASVWRYTTRKPRDDWFAEKFDDSGWRLGESGFGTRQTPNAEVRSEWRSSDIWIRRTIDLPSKPTDKLQLRIFHDEDAEVYINGVLAGRTTGYTTDYRQLPISPEAFKTLREKGNVVAVRCHQTQGGQFIDVGFATVTPVE